MLQEIPLRRERVSERESIKYIKLQDLVMQTILTWKGISKACAVTAGREQNSFIILV